jgi:hypothetical protein
VLVLVEGADGGCVLCCFRGLVVVVFELMQPMFRCFCTHMSSLTTDTSMLAVIVVLKGCGTPAHAQRRQWIEASIFNWCLLLLHTSAPELHMSSSMLLHLQLCCCCLPAAAQVGAMMMENLVDIDWADVRVSSLV